MNRHVTLIALVVAIASGCGESVDHQKKLYDSWCKLHGRRDITIDEWQMLREEYMLPGGDVRLAAEKADEAMRASAFSAGMAAGSSH